MRADRNELWNFARGGATFAFCDICVLRWPAGPDKWGSGPAGRAHRAVTSRCAVQQTHPRGMDTRQAGRVTTVWPTSIHLISRIATGTNDQTPTREVRGSEVIERRPHRARSAVTRKP